MTRCFTLSDLFAGKMHALVYRTWKNRVKGRDWYDFEWYVRNRVPLDFKHLQVRAAEFNDIELTRESFLETLRERLASSDVEQVKQDVIPFLRDPRELDIWSNDYFLQLIMLNSTEVLTISLGIAKLQSEMSTDYGLIMAGAALAAVPIIIVFLAFQKYFTKGITMGAVKG